MPTVTKSKLSIEYTCQSCHKRKQSTRRRSIKVAGFMGPCGDSFCYASCEMDVCRPFTATVCDDCMPGLGTEA